MQDRTELQRATHHLSDPDRDCEVLSLVHYQHWDMFCYGVSSAHKKNTFCLLSWAAVHAACVVGVFWQNFASLTLAASCFSIASLSGCSDIPLVSFCVSDKYVVKP